MATLGEHGRAPSSRARSPFQTKHFSETQEHAVQETVRFWTYIKPTFWHRFGITERHTVRNNADKIAMETVDQNFVSQGIRRACVVDDLPLAAEGFHQQISKTVWVNGCRGLYEANVDDRQLRMRKVDSL